MCKGDEGIKSKCAGVEHEGLTYAEMRGHVVVGEVY